GAAPDSRQRRSIDASAAHPLRVAARHGLEISGDPTVIRTLRHASARFAENKMAQGAIVAFAIKVNSSFLNIAMLTIAARAMGPAEFGLFAIWFNAISFLAVIALCGQETLIVRSWSEYIQERRFDLARGAVSFGVAVCLSAAMFWAG